MVHEDSEACIMTHEIEKRREKTAPLSSAVSRFAAVKSFQKSACASVLSLEQT